MLAYLKRLVTAGAAYQAGDLLAKALAIFTLPLYTHYLAPAAYGAAETLLTSVILVSILLRLGVGEAFVRFHFDDDDPGRRARLAAGTVVFVGVTSSVAAVVVLAVAGPLSRALLGFRDPWLLSIAVLGLWAFTNLEVAYSLLRVEERARTYLKASIFNVVVSVGLTAFLVVVEGQGARGLLGGNFVGTTATLLGLWWVERGRLGAPVRDRSGGPDPAPGLPVRRMLAFGLPTVPVDAAVYALQVVDRAYLFRVSSPAAAGLYAVSIKLATVVFVAVRGFQYAWPPLAYSVQDDAEAGRLYSVVTTYYVLVTGTVVTGVTLLGRWLVRILAAPEYYGAYRALPWLALGWALYGLYLVFVVIAGRAKMTVRILPAAGLGLGVNVVGLVVLVPGSGIAGAGIALCAAYAAMVVGTYLLTRGLFSVGFEWARLARLVAVLG
ncbi:MAG: lipopolysaccharide biosynthesis protein, partial [Actinobacteria bacterium]|nr:lipopolysaccharide biosynthesis protein [Actinomycetota bacterium]